MQRGYISTDASLQVDSAVVAQFFDPCCRREQASCVSWSGFGLLRVSWFDWWSEFRHLRVYNPTSPSSSTMISKVGTRFFLHGKITRRLLTLAGPGGSAAGSGILFLGTRLNREDGSAACKALGESLWDPELKLSSIKPNLDFLVYDGRVAKDEKFWVGGADGSPQILSAKGVISTGESADTLPVLCTHTAPFSNVASQDTSERWRVSVHSNNEDVIGYYTPHSES